MTSAIKWNTAPIGPTVHRANLDMLQRAGDAGRRWAHEALDPTSLFFYVSAAGFTDAFMELIEASGHPYQCWDLDDLYAEKRSSIMTKADLRRCWAALSLQSPRALYRSSDLATSWEPSAFGVGCSTIASTLYGAMINGAFSERKLLTDVGASWTATPGTFITWDAKLATWSPIAYRSKPRFMSQHSRVPSTLKRSRWIGDSSCGDAPSTDVTLNLPFH